MILLMKNSQSMVLVLPADFENEMRLAHVIEVFEKLQYSHKKEYVAWIEAAKKPEIRVKRIAEMIRKLST